MIKEFVERWEANKETVRAKFAAAHPSTYKELVETVIQAIVTPEKYGDIDPKRVHEIDDGDCQGTLLYVIPSNTYQPFDYWYVRVSYGSCSGCDTLEGVRSETSYSDKTPNEKQVKEYMDLALHVVQGLKKMARYGE